MSVENTPGSAMPDPGFPSPELQNANAENAPDGGDVDASSEGAADAQPEDKTPEHRKASYRFSEMSRQIRDLQLQLAQREGMLEAFARQPTMGAQNAPAPPVQEQPAPQGPAAPNPADFPEGQYDPRFIEALADYRAELKIQAALDRQSQQSQIAAQKEAERRAFEQGRERFMTVLDQAEKAGATGATQVLEIAGRDRQAADLLMSVSHPVETAEWLADNQEWLRAIMQTRDPVQRAIVVGRVDQHIASHLASQRAQSSARPATPTETGTAQTQPVPAASTVAQPTVRTGAGGRPFNPASASFEQYEAWRKANPQG